MTINLAKRDITR